MKVELTTIELKALELKDINNFNDKKCASIMSISVKEYNDILNKAREKVYYKGFLTYNLDTFIAERPLGASTISKDTSSPSCKSLSCPFSFTFE